MEDGAVGAPPLLPKHCGQTRRSTEGQIDTEDISRWSLGARLRGASSPTDGPRGDGSVFNSSLGANLHTAAHRTTCVRWTCLQLPTGNLQHVLRRCRFSHEIYPLSWCGQGHSDTRLPTRRVSKSRSRSSAKLFCGCRRPTRTITTSSGMMPPSKPGHRRT